MRATAAAAVLLSWPQGVTTVPRKPKLAAARSTVFLAWQSPFPPSRGDHFRAAGLLRGLAAAGPVRLVTLADRPDAATPPPGIVETHLPLLAHERLAAWSADPPWPLGLHLYWSPAAAGRLAARLAGQRFDLAVCFQLRAALYGPYLPAARRVLELTDSLALYRAEAGGRAVSRLDAWRRRLLWAGVEDLERRLPAEFDATWLCAEADLRHLRDGLGARGRLQHVPQGCFPAVAGDAASLVAARRGRPARLLFLGNLAYPPNRDAVRHLAGELLPALGGDPRPEVWVAGDGWPSAARELPALRWLGFVPDLAALAPEVDLSLNPVRFGSGAKSKVAESWRLGLPVVSSPAGACGYRPGPALHLADGPRAFAQAIASLLADAGGYRAAVADALARCREQSWEAVVRRALDPDDPG